MQWILSEFNPGPEEEAASSRPAGPIAQVMLAYIRGKVGQDGRRCGITSFGLRHCARHRPLQLTRVIVFHPFDCCDRGWKRGSLKNVGAGPCGVRARQQALAKYMDTSVHQNLLYTGSGRVGHIVAAAAAKHLTPITLKLGEKNPIYIDPTCSLPRAAHCLLWGKTGNAGQVCITGRPHVITRGWGARSSSRASTQCWAGQTKGKIVLCGKSNQAERFITPTIVRDCKADDSLMQE
ncbi:ALDH-like protein [Athelia psychrophila]|uniref:ALDH-like protein n=1 Tax=Athelia psychrophila TaxID=1759441 RepID=A0A166KEV0_9AGAM|nr:ALDH-like protein [Fibularhizoctonia sp. CBS 109695]